MQRDAQARYKPDFQQISRKDVNAFLAIRIEVVQDCKLSVKLYWTKDELYHVPSCSSVMPHDHFLKILKYISKWQ
jgi:hypothetical protein